MSEYSVQILGYCNKDGFTEYQLRVTDLSTADYWDLSKRYKEIRCLHEHLRLKYPSRIPSFPGKRLFGNQDPSFIRQRQQDLQVYLTGVLQLEPDCHTIALAKFLQINHQLVEVSNNHNNAVRQLGQAPPVIGQAAVVGQAVTTVVSRGELDGQTQGENVNQGNHTIQSQKANITNINAINGGHMGSGEVVDLLQQGSPEIQNNQNLNVSVNQISNQNTNMKNENLQKNLPQNPNNAANQSGNQSMEGTTTAGTTMSPEDETLREMELIERTQNAFIDLAQTPTSLDQREVETRLAAYKLNIERHILTSPIDPIFLTPNSQYASDNTRSMLDPSKEGGNIPIDPTVFSTPLVNDGVETLDQYISTLKPDSTLVNPDKLIAQFLEK